MRRRIIGLWLLSTCLATVPLHAQYASSTCGWHFLEDMDTPPTLARLLTRTAELSERHREAVDNILEWYHDCNHTSARRAAMSLRNEIRRTNSSDPFLRALLGIALVRGPDIHVLNGEGALLRPVNRHTNAEIEGVRMLAPVVRETGWPEVVQELAAVAVITTKSESLQVASESLRAAPDSMRDAEFWAALAEVELARGEYQAAIDAATQAGTDVPRAARALGIAHMLADPDPTAGAQIYLDGLDVATAGNGLQRYFDDLRLLLSDEERADWEKLSDGHGDWIARKWEWRAFLAGIRIPQRLAEHHRRMVVVLAKYRRTSYRGATPASAALADSAGPDIQLVDDRGIIYLRHGEPTQELRMAPSREETEKQNIVSRIAWVYSRPGVVQPVYEFDRVGSRPDYLLVVPNPTCGDRDMNRGAGSTIEYPQRGDYMDWAMRLHSYDPSLALYYINCENSPDVAALRYEHLKDQARRAGLQMVHSENAAPRLQHPLTAAMNLYSFAAPAGRTELVAYVAVDAGNLRPSGDTPPLSYALRVLFAAGDPVSELLVRNDTLIAFRQPAALPEDAVIGTAIPLRIAPTEEARVTLTLVNGYESQQGQVLATSRTVPRFEAGAFGMSDIVIGEARDGAWQRGEYRLAPINGHAVSEGSPFRLYYELYGMAVGDPTTVQIVVTPGRDESLLRRLADLVADRSALVLEFEEQARTDADRVTRVEREFAAELEPGSYVVTITVRNTRTAESVTRETNLIVLERS